MSVKPIPEGYNTITNYFSVRDAGKYIQFLTNAFDAEQRGIHFDQDGAVMHAELKIGNSIVMVGQVPKNFEEEKLMKSLLYMYVIDSDKTYKKAIEAGGFSIMEPTNQYYGDRSGAVTDPAGNQWWIATHIEDMSTEELQRRAREKNI